MPEFSSEGYLLLAASALCSVGIGAIFKIAAIRSIDTSGLIAVNYVVAAAAGFVIAGGELGQMLSNPLLAGVSAAIGAFFIAGFYALAISTEVAGVALTLSSWRMSVIVPFVASWLVWSETPGSWQLVGLLVAILAFILITDPFGRQQSNQKMSIAAILVAVFAVGGIVDVLLKVVDETFHLEGDMLNVTFLIFGTAALLMCAILGVRAFSGYRFDPQRTLLPGAILGLLNLGTILFVLGALRTLPGTVVFPVNNIAIVVGAALLGTLFWNEKLSRTTIAGIAVALLSLVLLTIS